MTQKENIDGAAHALADAERYLSRARGGHMAYVTAVLGAQQIALRAMLVELTELSHQAARVDEAAAEEQRAAGAANVAAVERMRRELAGEPTKTAPPLAGESQLLRDAIKLVDEPER